MSHRLLRLALLSASLLLTACSEPAKPVVATPQAAPVVAEPTVFAVVYQCPDGTVFTTFPRGDNAQIDFANRSMQGTGNATGSEECVGTDAKDVWEAAKLRGVAVRAIGNEPGWLLEIAPNRQLVFAWDYGNHRAAAATPAPQVDAASHTTVYTAKTGAGDLRVELQDGQCSDGMSDLRYPTSAKVTLAGKSYAGCARTL